ncbi:MAG: alpha/beta hydrolase [Deltaproteobacteria bacterium]|nr:alpha/beta hydrolase [Deltaproteobacteria bacterium]
MVHDELPFGAGPVSSSTDPALRRIRLRDGRILAYAEYGDPYGLPVVYCHGGLGSRLEIAFAADTCRRSGVRLLAIDRPGIGASDPQPGRTLVGWPYDVAHLADRLGITRCAVLGWSAGGPYALACASRLGRRVARVAIVGGLAPLELPATVAELGMRAERLLLRLAIENPGRARILLRMAGYLPPRLLRAVLLYDLTSPSDRAVVTGLPAESALDGFYEAIRCGVDGAVDDYRVLASSWELGLGDITTEVNLWHGQEDNLVPVSHAERLSAHLPNARLIVLPGRGHFLLHVELEHVLSTLRYR